MYFHLIFGITAIKSTLNLLKWNYTSCNFVTDELNKKAYSVAVTAIKTTNALAFLEKSQRDLFIGFYLNNVYFI